MHSTPQTFPVGTLNTKLNTQDQEVRDVEFTGTANQESLAEGLSVAVGTASDDHVQETVIGDSLDSLIRSTKPKILTCKIEADTT